MPTENVNFTGADQERVSIVEGVSFGDCTLVVNLFVLYKLLWPNCRMVDDTMGDGTGDSMGDGMGYITDYLYQATPTYKNNTSGTSMIIPKG